MSILQGIAYDQKKLPYGLVIHLKLLHIPENLHPFNDRQKSQFLLPLWLLLGCFLRLMNLGGKPPWTDEFATMIFSRADNYSRIPLNEIISAETLLSTLKGYPQQGMWEAGNFLIQNDNHPPLYFMLVNFWQKFFPLENGEYISINSVRLLSIIFSVVGIWSIYWLAKKTFNSELIAQLSAAFMVFSPFEIYLAQEARHYTLIILFVTASLALSLKVVAQLLEKKALSYPLVLGGILLSCMGLLIHYFFILTLTAEAIALLWFMVATKHFPTQKQWFRLGLIVLGVGIFGLIWKTQVLPTDYGSSMTDWIRIKPTNFLHWFSPPFQLLGTFVTMVMLLPIEGDFIPLVITFGLVMIIIGIRLIGFWRQGIKVQVQNPQYQPKIFFLTRFLLAVWGLFAVLTFGLGIDITRGARYSFTYFPAVILLFAVGLSYFWQRENIRFFGIENWGQNFPKLKSGTKAIAFILIVSFLSSLTVITNWGYQKYYHPEKIVNRIQQTEQPVLMVMPHKSQVQIGEMLGIAWEQNRRSVTTPTFFAFIPERQPDSLSSQDFEQLLETAPFPNFQLWTINFFEPLPLQHCSEPERFWITGYYSYIYQCTKK